MTRSAPTARTVGAVVITAMSLALTLAVAPAFACSLAAPADLEELIATGTSRELPGDPILAVYEQRHVAWTPSLLLRTERSASIVTRYWGDVEPPLGVRVHGEGLVAFLGFDECGNSASSNGHVEFEVLLSDDAARHGFWTDVGDLTIDEVRRGLSDRFGEPTEISTGLDDFVAAYALLLWPPVVFVAALVLLVLAAGRWRHTERVYSFSLPAALVGSGATFVASFAVDHFGTVDRILLMVAIGLAIGAGRLLGPLLGAVSGAIAAAGFVSHVRSAFGSGDVVFWIGFAAVITGIGHLVWRLRHWSRYAATFGIGVGAAMITAAWTWRLGATSEPLVLAAATAALIVAVSVAWWVVLREASSSPAPTTDTIDA